MLRVGLTGSIAVGKSYVASVLREVGCRVIDSDQTARQVVAPGTRGLKAITNTFGDSILSPDGSLDRSKLGKLVFTSEEKRLLLNSVIHPLILESQENELKQLERENCARIVVVDAALMIESGSYKRFSRVIVAFCDPETQLKRLMARNSILLAEAQRLVAAQMAQEEKKQFADYVIDTSNGFEETRAKTIAVFDCLMADLEASIEVP